MEKKIYVPTLDELYQMQEMGANVYNYLLVKAIELLILKGVKNPDKGILEDAIKDVKESYDIFIPICKMYPKEVQYSEFAKMEPGLCVDILKKSNQIATSNLEQLSYFSSSIASNEWLANEVISILNKELFLNPKYRFEYTSKEDSASKILDDIFSCQFPINNLYNQESCKLLMNIEPAYALKIKERFFNSLSCNESREIALIKSVGNYTMRYGISSEQNNQYMGKNIFKNPDKKTDLLVRTLKKYKKNIY